jgi:hypothetical protein
LVTVNASKQRIQWKEEAEAVFRQLKEEFGKIEHDFLFLPTKGTQLVLKTDAS